MGETQIHNDGYISTNNFLVDSRYWDGAWAKITNILMGGSYGRVWRDYRRACREIRINGRVYNRRQWDIQCERDNARKKIDHPDQGKFITNAIRRINNVGDND